VKDLFSLRHGRVDDQALEFRSAPAVASETRTEPELARHG
jgi:hypothetical protein